MNTYHVKCYETVNFTVVIEAESEEEARELAHEDINSHEVIAESTTDWDIEEVILEDDEWYNSLSEGKDYDSKENFINEVAKGIVESDVSGVLDDYGSKVDALVDSMGVTENKLAQGHVRKDLDAL